jgi:hypothetical protein
MMPPPLALLPLLWLRQAPSRTTAQGQGIAISSMGWILNVEHDPSSSKALPLSQAHETGKLFELPPTLPCLAVL